jgi:hypothetical protein
MANLTCPSCGKTWLFLLNHKYGICACGKKVLNPDYVPNQQLLKKRQELRNYRHAYIYNVFEVTEDNVLIQEHCFSNIQKAKECITELSKQEKKLTYSNALYYTLKEEGIL